MSFYTVQLWSDLAGIITLVWQKLWTGHLTGTDTLGDPVENCDREGHNIFLYMGHKVYATLT